MRIRVSADGTWLGLEWPPTQYVGKRHAPLLSTFLLNNSLYLVLMKSTIFKR
jgi:hypothetical protein